MNWKGTIVLLVLMVLAVLMSTGCGYHYTCKVTFGGPPCSNGGSSSGGGSFSSGGTGNGAGATDFLYSMPAGGNTSSGFTLVGAVINGGKFALLTGVTLPGVPIGFYSDFAILNKQYLYAPGTPDNNNVLGTTQVNAFSINHADGSLAKVTGSPFPSTGQNIVYNLAFDQGGKFLFVGGGNSNSANIAAFTVDASSGALTSAPGSPFPITAKPNAMAVDGSGKYLYVSVGVSGTGQIFGFAIDQTSGALTALTGSPFSVSSVIMNDMKTDSSGQFLIGTANAFADNTSLTNDPHLYVIPIDQTTGNLNAAVPFPTAHLAFAVTTNPAAPFVYGFTEDNTGSQTGIEGFSISATGTLTPIVGSPFTGVSDGFFGKFDQNGTQLFYPTSDFAGQSYAVAGADASTGVLTQTAAPTALGTSGTFAVTTSE